MRIVYLATGAGGMYCGTCLHSNTLAAALCKAGEDAILVPAYTPIRTDEENVSAGRVVFSALDVYLQQKSGLFRHTPWFLDRLLDRPTLLGWLGKHSSTTRPEALGELTVSMLQGEEGRQRKELEKLLHWLRHQIQPDVVHLCNVLMAGMARQITRRLGVPVVCTLSGEDIFLEKIPEPHYSQARTLLGQRCGDLAALISLNRYYADFMAQYLPVARDRIHVIPPGLNLAGHGDRLQPQPGAGPEPSAGRVVTIGYLARICPDKGLHLLAEALESVVEQDDLPPVRLHAAGYLAKGDAPYLAGIEARLQQRGLAHRFQYLGELDRCGKTAFLQSLDVMSLPTVYRESKGISVLEAWANGVPVVLPAHGTFPELVEDTGGGLLCEPHDARALADALKQLIQHPDQAAECGRRAQQAIYARYHADLMAQRTIELYNRVCGRGTRG